MAGRLPIRVMLQFDRFRPIPTRSVSFDVALFLMLSIELLLHKKGSLLMNRASYFKPSREGSPQWLLWNNLPIPSRHI